MAKESEQKSSSIQPSDCQQRTCWQEATSRLSDTDKALLDFSNQDNILDGGIATVKQERDICQQRHWKFKRKNGQHIILRDVCEKIVKGWIRSKQLVISLCSMIQLI